MFHNKTLNSLSDASHFKCNCRFEPVFYEHMDKTLVLLRCRLLWNVRDIIYWKPGAAADEGNRQLEHDVTQPPGKVLAKHKQ